MKYKFLYRDQLLTSKDLERYLPEGVIHECEEVAASFLRGGLLTGCNTRFLFITNIGGSFGLVNDDYRKQGFYLFDKDLYYDVYDKYEVGVYTQLLLSPDRRIDDDTLEEVIASARADFNQLLHTPPVQVLDTKEWRQQIRVVLGKNGKMPPHAIK